MDNWCAHPDIIVEAAAHRATTRLFDKALAESSVHGEHDAWALMAEDQDEHDEWMGSVEEWRGMDGTLV